MNQLAWGLSLVCLLVAFLLSLAVLEESFISALALTCILGLSMARFYSSLEDSGVVA